MTIGTCRAGGEASPSGPQPCSVGGEPPTSAAPILSSPAAPRQPRWLAQNRQRAAEVRKSESQASHQRMESFLETDRRRQEAEKITASQTQTRERRAVLLAAVVFLLIAALTAGVVVSILL